MRQQGTTNYQPLPRLWCRQAQWSVLVLAARQSILAVELPCPPGMIREHTVSNVVGSNEVLIGQWSAMIEDSVRNPLPKLRSRRTGGRRQICIISPTLSLAQAGARRKSASRISGGVTGPKYCTALRRSHGFGISPRPFRRRASTVVC